jgi:EamA domain-containing membrane protein RarD
MIGGQHKNSQEVTDELKKKKVVAHYIFTQTCATMFLYVLTMQSRSCWQLVRTRQMVTQAQPCDVVDNLWSYRWLQGK